MKRCSEVAVFVVALLAASQAAWGQGIAHVSYLQLSEAGATLEYLNNAGGDFSSLGALLTAEDLAVLTGVEGLGSLPLYDIAIDANGNWHVAHLFFSLSDANAEAPLEPIIGIAYRNGDLVEPEVVVTTALGQLRVFVGLAIDVDSDGAVHISYLESALPDVKGDEEADAAIKYTNNRSGAFLPPETLVDSTTTPLFPGNDLAIDESGNWHLAFMTANTDDSPIPSFSVRYLNGEMAEDVEVSTGDFSIFGISLPLSPRIDVDGDEIAHIVFVEAFVNFFGKGIGEGEGKGEEPPLGFSTTLEAKYTNNRIGRFLSTHTIHTFSDTGSALDDFISAGSALILPVMDVAVDSNGDWHVVLSQNKAADANAEATAQVLYMNRLATEARVIAVSDSPDGGLTAPRIDFAPIFGAGDFGVPVAPVCGAGAGDSGRTGDLLMVVLMVLALIGGRGSRLQRKRI